MISVVFSFSLGRKFLHRELDCSRVSSFYGGDCLFQWIIFYGGHLIMGFFFIYDDSFILQWVSLVVWAFFF
jgi:hypothetical protein